MMSFNAESKFRSLSGKAYGSHAGYGMINISQDLLESNVVSVGCESLAVICSSSSGGSFVVLPLNKTGRVPINYPRFRGHEGPVLDVNICPFDDTLIASGSYDSSVFVWKISGVLEKDVTKPNIVLSDHKDKISSVLFHHNVSGLLGSGSSDGFINIWDLEKEKPRAKLDHQNEGVYSFDYSYMGSTIVSTCKDKKIRLFDLRNNEQTGKINGHKGPRSSKVVWLGNTQKFVTTGFGHPFERQIFLWDTRNSLQPIQEEIIDKLSGLLMPFYDNTSKLLFVAGKGDCVIRCYEMNNEHTTFSRLTEYRCKDTLHGLGFLPKRSLNASSCEIARAYQVHVNSIDTMSFSVLRKKQNPQDDLYQDIYAGIPAMCPDEFFEGKNANPITKPIKDIISPKIYGDSKETFINYDISTNENNVVDTNSSTNDLITCTNKSSSVDSLIRNYNTIESTKHDDDKLKDYNKHLNTCLKDIDYLQQDQSIVIERINNLEKKLE